jgi:hypothetical protein
VGDIDLLIPKLQAGGFLTSILETVAGAIRHFTL